MTEKRESPILNPNLNPVITMNTFAIHDRPRGLRLRPVSSIESQNLVVPEGQIAVYQAFWYAKEARRAAFEIYVGGREIPMELPGGALCFLAEGEGTAVCESCRDINPSKMLTEMFVLNTNGAPEVLDYNPLIKLPLNERASALRIAIANAAFDRENWQWADNNVNRVRSIASFGRGCIQATFRVPGIGVFSADVWVELSGDGGLQYGWLEWTVMPSSLVFHPQSNDIAPLEELKEAISACVDIHAIRPLGLGWVIRDLLRRHIEYLRADSPAAPKPGTTAWGNHQRWLHSWTPQELIERSACIMTLSLPEPSKSHDPQ